MMPDIGLAAVLLIGIPAFALWREASGVRRSRIARYRSSTLMIVVCVAALASQWIVSGRNAALLGLNLPPTCLGWSCLLGAALLLTALGAAMRHKPSMVTAEGDDDPLPQTPAERTGFVLFALVAGTTPRSYPDQATPTESDRPGRCRHIADHSDRPSRSIRCRSRRALHVHPLRG